MYFAKAQNEIEYNQIFELRRKIFLKKFPYLLNATFPHPAQDEFDGISTLFYASANGTVVGSCRITPFVNNEWEISRNLPANLLLTYDPKVTIQLNRVYIDDQYVNQNLHAFLFYEFSKWVLEYTSYRRYFATCNAGLVRLYRGLGARLDQGDGFKLKGRGNHDYYLVSGCIEEFKSIIETKFYNADVSTIRNAHSI